MVCATLYNTKRTKRTDKFYQATDFIPAEEPDPATRIQSAEDIYAQLMKYLPPEQELM